MLGREQTSNSPAADHNEISVEVEEVDQAEENLSQVVDEVPISPGRLSDRRMRQVLETTSSRNGRQASTQEGRSSLQGRSFTLDTANVLDSVLTGLPVPGLQDETAEHIRAIFQLDPTDPAAHMT